MNYFELFGFTPSFDIELPLLAERYRELQRAVHPDKFAGGSAQENLLAVQKTAQINDGYQVLKAPLSRAEHILALKGIDISHETTTVKDTEFLLQQMEWREALGSIKESNEPELLIDELRDLFSCYQSAIFKDLSQLLQSDQRDAQLMAADQIRKLKFMAKLQDELAKIEDSLFD